MTERTFSIIKPDATERNLTGKINAVIEGAGLRIVAQRRIRMTEAQAKKFYEWALTPGAQQFGAAAKQFQLPSNAGTPVDARVPNIKSIKLINYDFAKYGSSAERTRLLSKWDREVKVLPK